MTLILSFERENFGGLVIVSYFGLLYILSIVLSIFGIKWFRANAHFYEFLYSKEGQGNRLFKA